jgi:hypothetical protein
MKTKETKTESKSTVSLTGRGKLVRDLVAKGVDLKEFCDVVKESYPVCGINWLTKHYKRATARLAKKTAAPPKPAAAAVAAPVVETPKPKGKAKKV